MKEFFIICPVHGSRDYVLITLRELGGGDTANYQGVLKLIAEKGYKMPGCTFLRSRLGQIPDLSPDVVVNIPLSDKELKWLIRQGSKNKVRIPEFHPDDILFPASTLWLLEVAD